MTPSGQGSWRLIKKFTYADDQLTTGVKIHLNLLLEARSFLEERVPAILEKGKIILQKMAQIQAFIEQLRTFRDQRFPLKWKKDPLHSELFDEAEHIILTEEPDDIERAVAYVE